MVVQKSNTIRIICLLGLMFAVFDHETTAATKKPGFMCKLFRSRPKSSAHSKNVPFVDPLADNGRLTKPALLPMEDVATMRDLVMHVQEQSMIKPIRDVVVSALSRFLLNVRGVANFEDQLRDKILRPCKQVHTWPEEPWWKELRTIIGTHIDKEWLTMKEVCTFIVLNVDLAHSNLIKDAFLMRSTLTGYDATATLPPAMPINDIAAQDTNERVGSDQKWIAIDTIQSLLAKEDIHTLKSLGLLVQRRTAASMNIEAPKDEVVRALSIMMSNVQGVANFEAQFRDKILRPCKHVHKIFTELWWNSPHLKTELTQSNQEWLTIKQVCTFIVHNVDSRYPSLITETFVALFENSSGN